MTNTANIEGDCCQPTSAAETCRSAFMRLSLIDGTGRGNIRRNATAALGSLFRLPSLD